MPPAAKVTISPEYRAHVPRSWDRWLHDLPDLVASYLEAWDLEIVGELPLSFMFVAPVVRLEDGRQCVLKVQPTDNPEAEGAERELLGLRLASPFTVEVLQEDAKAGVLLLERAMPGESLIPLAESDDDLASETLADVIQNYGRPVVDPEAIGLRSVIEHREAFERYDRGPHGASSREAAARRDPTLMVRLGMDELGTGYPGLREARATAERVLDELIADKPEAYLLHGDLHHDNVLRDEERGLLVIDAWGLYGDRTREVGVALRNPLGLVSRTEDIEALYRRRLSIYAGVLDLDRDRLAAWCYVESVISALWNVEDGGEMAEDDSQIRGIAALRRMI